MKSLIAILLGLACFFSPAQGEVINTTIATWTKIDSRNVLEISLEKSLSQRQLNLINSGFSTFSILTLRDTENPNNEQQPLFKVSCTVKYDTWQERYDVARIEKNAQTALVKDFQKYSQYCLGAQLDNAPLLYRFAQKGGLLDAVLLIDQITINKASEIKEWLIRQQSGVMQGLFSHMLGDLKLSERIDVQVRIPPNLTISKSENTDTMKK